MACEDRVVSSKKHRRWFNVFINILLVSILAPVFLKVFDLVIIPFFFPPVISDWIVKDFYLTDSRHPIIKSSEALFSNNKYNIKLIIGSHVKAVDSDVEVKLMANDEMIYDGVKNLKGKNNTTEIIYDNMLDPSRHNYNGKVKLTILIEDDDKSNSTKNIEYTVIFTKRMGPMEISSDDVGHNESIQDFIMRTRISQYVRDTDSINVDYEYLPDQDNRVSNVIITEGTNRIIIPVNYIEIDETDLFNNLTCGILNVTNRPIANYSVQMSYMRNVNRTVLFGGISTPNNSPEDGTWIFDGVNWHSTSSAPIRFFLHAMAYNPISGNVICFSGSPYASEGNVTNETWIFDENSENWARYNAANSPRSRTGAAMVYVQQLNGVVLFGGRYGDRALNDMHVFDGNTWTEIDQGNNRPRGVCLHDIAYDENRRKIVLFGGGIFNNGVRSPVNTTWEYDIMENEWELMIGNQINLPSPRMGHKMIYDRSRRRVILYGGENDGIYFNDLYSWNGTSWQRIQYGGQQIRRGYFGMVYVDAIRGYALYGGIMENEERVNSTCVISQGAGN